MLAWTDPAEAYRLSEVDARLDGARAADLVTFCLEQVVQSVGSALSADIRGNTTQRSKSLARALTSLTALEMGIDSTAPLADALLQMYGAARRSLLDCMVSFDSERLEMIRADFAEIMAAMTQTS